MVSRDQIHSDFIRDQEACGAMYEPDGIGVHAAKLAFGYLQLARKLGAKVHVASPVLSCRKMEIFFISKLRTEL